MQKLLLAGISLLACACSHVQVATPCFNSRNAGLDAKHTIQPVVLSPMLIGGVPANPSEWPASIYTESEGNSCSSTLIGDRVVISAAHCMKNDGTIKFSAGPNKYTGRCEHSPEYEPKGKAANESADMAVCLVNRPVIGVEFERVATSQRFKAGDEIRLSGFGCIRSPGVGGNDGIFRIGQAKITATPYGKNYYLVSEGSAALCFGDSGGAAFEEKQGNRELVGINSRGDIERVSYLTSVAAPSMQGFIKDFAKRNGVKVCGIHSDARGCRPLTAPVDPTILYQNGVGCLKLDLESGYISKKPEIFERFKTTMDQLEVKP